MSNQRPFSIKVFIPNGDPDGLRIIEKSNWTGVGVVFKHTNFKQAITRPEFERTGVYVLIGPSKDSSLPTIYIGEGDPVKARLSSHYTDTNKEFWEWAIFFVTKDSSLNKAHVKYLESRLLALATIAKQSKLDNSQTSLPPSLSEAETADVDSFLLDMLSIYPLVGLSIFERIETKKTPLNQLYLNVKGITATGYEDSKGFVVRKGSQAIKDVLPSMHQYMAIQRRDLIEQDVMTADSSGLFTFTQDHVFTSPSTASGVLLGRADNGRISWKNKEGITLKELQAKAAEQEINSEG